ncbi:hypothetical protein [Youngiibacter fragilis]|uniref:Uncharacterized protein n=1 Tax=Youngiibacter fragilis 232.1 TaxID=994573 RepID=V7I9M8_9CLOT|nr:hypothetical protein [Youngiibacter fragilis]ETA82558.1 hypothetical protein T472_0200550 [Youngiibacter fragilis 232.1]
MRPLKLLLAFIVAFAAVSVWIWMPKDLEGKLPENLPKEAVIADGIVVESKEALFDNGKGYVIVVRSSMGFDETIKAIEDEFESKGMEFEKNGPSGSEERFASFDAKIGDRHEAIEVIGNSSGVIVNHAVHMLEWFMK